MNYGTKRARRYLRRVADSMSKTPVWMRRHLYRTNIRAKARQRLREGREMPTLVERFFKGYWD